jgi:hypothetical protein
MGMPVAQLLKQISGMELAQWAAYEALYGQIGVEARVDRAAALIASQLANTFLPPKQQPYQVSDFLPRRRSRALDDFDVGEEEDGQPAP